jgi:hypothetical protein
MELLVRGKRPVLPLSAPGDLEKGLAMLLQAHEYTEQLRCCPWDFAVEIDRLRTAGLTHSDLRWLVHQGHLKHGTETTRRGTQQRSFKWAANLAFADNTCFVLTPSGVAYVRQLCADLHKDEAAQAKEEGGAGVGASVGGLPCWDAQRRELRYKGLLVKQFKQPAESQEIILGAFEEEGWPPRIDDPLPPQRDQDPKRHLHVTITNLNRHQKHRVIRFAGDGTGRGICWEVLHRYSSATAERV